MLSVIMLTCNREKMVSDMINDIIGQSYKDFEYIIVDNGSHDKSGEIADYYAKKDRRIKVIHLHEPHMIGYARNVGVRNSSGQFIVFVDDDDRISNDYLEFMINLIGRYNADISICGTYEDTYTFDGTVTRTEQCISEETVVMDGAKAVSMLLDRQLIRAGMPGKMYRREILEKYPFVENYRNEDVHTQYKYLLSGKVVFSGYGKYYITRHAGNVSGFNGDESRWNRQTIQDYIDAYEHRTEFLKDNGPEWLYQKALYSEWSLKISMLNKIETLNPKDCLELAGKIKDELKTNENRFINMPYIKDFEKDWLRKYIV